MSDEQMPPVDAQPIEFRESVLTGVDFKKRIIDLIAVPYEEEATVDYRGEMWHEIFSRGSYDGIEDHAGRVRVNRGHDTNRTVGKAVQFQPSRKEGLVSHVRIAPTLLGDETLALADEDMLSPSVGFTVRRSDQALDRRTMVRRINRAFLDHISLVEDPAYQGARVLAVREGLSARPPAKGPLATPELDAFLDDELLSWANTRASTRQSGQ